MARDAAEIAAELAGGSMMTKLEEVRAEAADCAIGVVNARFLNHAAFFRLPPEKRLAEWLAGRIGLLLAEAETVIDALAIERAKREAEEELEDAA